MKYFNIYKELEDKQSKLGRNFTALVTITLWILDVFEKAGLVLKAILEVVDPLDLINILLKNKNILRGSSRDSKWFSKALKRMSSFFNSSWSIHFVEM